MRISTQLAIQASSDDLVTLIFGGSGNLLNEVLDTLARGTSGTYDLIEGEQDVVIALGDIAIARMVYLEADGEFSVTFGSGTATRAVVTGVAGTYPTAFVGGELLDLLIDGVAVAVSFDVADQTRDQVLARVNFFASLAGFVATQIAYRAGTQLELRSPTTGGGSTVEVLGTTDPAVLTALGLVVGVTAGAAAQPGTSPLAIVRPADATANAVAYGVKSYFLATCSTTQVKVSNTTAGPIKINAFVAGDLADLGC